MWQTFKDLLKSKKAMMAFISSGVWVAGKFGLQLDTEELLPVVGPLWGYIAAQAGADWGKEAHKEANKLSDAESAEDLT